MALDNILSISYQLGIDRIKIIRHANNYVLYDGYINELKYITFRELNNRDVYKYFIDQDKLLIKVY